MNTLVPELSVSDFDKSLRFYRDVVGFEVVFERPENRFAYLRFHGSELMIEEDRLREGTSALWIIEPLDYPRGRGLNISIDCPDADGLAARLVANGFSLRKPIGDEWYRENEIEHGERNFLVQDPDGYLLRFTQRLGTRPVTRDRSE
jgi:catechol 2,3-dioxygenase-like lactoylglutathione lyase family enzyme